MALDMQGFSVAGIPVLNDPAMSEDSLLSLKSGGSTEAQISKFGAVRAGDGAAVPTVGVPGLTFVDAPATGFRRWGTGGVIFAAQGADIWGTGLSIISMRSTGSFRWTSSGDPTLAADLCLERDAADSFAQRRSTNPQTWRLYNTYTNSTNYERLGITWASNELKLDVEVLGTGVQRDMTLQSGGGTVGVGADLQFTEMTAPAAPAANKARLYIEDNGSGKTRLMARFPTGAAVQIAIEP